MARKTPTLDLTPELPEVVSRDFNLFYRPEAEPEIAGMKEFTASLDNFVNGAGSSMVIASTVKEKKINSAEAVKDYAENKLKFKEAVKSGKIDKTANPFYLEKYKELSLNEYASEFNSVLVKRYGDLDVKTDITEGAFDNFYQDTLKKFVADKGLGTFDALDLEKGFFKETSNYRASLEAQHQQTQLELFKTKFNEKVKNRVVGIVQKYKDYKLDPTVDGDATNIYELIANDINSEIKSLIEVGDNGRDVIDTAFQGLAEYVTVATDIEFAKKLIKNVPKFLTGGTGSVEKIGRIKVKQEELYNALIESAEEKKKKENDFITTSQTSERLNTYNYLQNQKDNPDFNIIEYKNDPRRTNQEILAINAFQKDSKIIGTDTDDFNVIVSIETLLEERKFLEAHELVSQAFRNGDITTTTKNNYHNTRIANSRDFKDHPLFIAVRPVNEGIKALDSILASNSSGGDKLKASNSKIYIQDKLYLWIQENKDDPKYQGKSYLLQADFEKEYLTIVNNLKTFTDVGDTLFGQGTGLSGEGTVVQNIDAEINKKKAKSEESKLSAQQIANMTIDLDKLNSADFQSKYKMTKEQFAKQTGIKQK